MAHMSRIAIVAISCSASMILSLPAAAQSQPHDGLLPRPLEAARLIFAMMKPPLADLQVRTDREVTFRRDGSPIRHIRMWAWCESDYVGSLDISADTGEVLLIADANARVDIGRATTFRQARDACAAWIAAIAAASHDSSCRMEGGPRKEFGNWACTFRAAHSRGKIRLATRGGRLLGMTAYSLPPSR